MAGIVSYGGYIPRLRLSRMAIFQSMGWFAPATMMVAQGERSMCNWDEDSLTMAVAAARDCMVGMNRDDVDALYLCSTTLPFADRQNSGVVSATLNLKNEVLTADFTASQKAGTTGVITALDAIKGGEKKSILVPFAPVTALNLLFRHLVGCGFKDNERIHAVFEQEFNSSVELLPVVDRLAVGLTVDAGTMDGLVHADMPESGICDEWKDVPVLWKQESRQE